MNVVQNVHSPPPLRELAILKKLEYQHQLLEEKAKQHRKDKRKFKPHPVRILSSDTDSTTTNTTSINESDSPLLHPVVIKDRKKGNKAKSPPRRRRSPDVLINRDTIKLHNKKSNQENESLKVYSLSSDDENDHHHHNDDNISLIMPLPKLYENPTSPATPSHPKRADDQNKEKAKKPSQNPYIPMAFGLNQKFRSVFEKSLQSLNEIRTIILRGITPPDGEEELQKRNVRVKEFANRYSRNYLYPLSRQLKELPKHLQFNNQLIMPKLLSVYQVICNSLQAFHNHLPTAGGEFNQNQLRILMASIIEVCEFYRNLIQQFEEDDYLLEFVDSFKIQAELTVQNINGQPLSVIAASSENILRTGNSNVSLTKQKTANSSGGEQNKNEKNQKNEKRKIRRPFSCDNNKRYAMYATTASFRRDLHWRRAVENLSRNKINVKSKYKTATYKHRPPPQLATTATPVPPPSQASMSPNKKSQKKPFQSIKITPRSGDSKPTRLNTPINEDLIKTMVELGKSNIEVKNGLRDDREKNEKKQETREHQMLIKLLQYALKQHHQNETSDVQPNEQNIDNNNESIHKNKFNNDEYLNEIMDLVGENSNKDLLKKMLDNLSDTIDPKKQENEHQQQQEQELKLEILNSQSSLIGEKLNNQGNLLMTMKKNGQEQITITGEKNARLICIKSADSAIENNKKLDEQKDKKNAEIKTTKRNNNKRKLKKGSKAKPIAHHHNHHQSNSINLKLRLQKKKLPKKQLQPLEKFEAISAIQYKFDFYQYLKTKLMYKKSTTCEPWILMNKISDQILDQCLLAVAREIEVNDVIDKVYQSELQLD